MLNIDEIENRILEMITAGEGARFQQLKFEIGLIQERLRTFSGAGFVSRFTIEHRAELLRDNKSFYVGDVSGHTSALQHGFGSILFIDSGVINRLEVYTYGEPWPDLLPDLALTYDGTESRQELENMR